MQVIMFTRDPISEINLQSDRGRDRELGFSSHVALSFCFRIQQPKKSTELRHERDELTQSKSIGMQAAPVWLTFFSFVLIERERERLLGNS